jgi:hypothetical protein
MRHWFNLFKINYVYVKKTKIKYLWKGVINI